MLGDKTVYQKYTKTSARVGYALNVWKWAQVQGLRSPDDLQSEGTRTRALSPLRRFGQVPSYSPHRLVNQCNASDKICTRLKKGHAQDLLSSRWSLGHIFDVESIWLSKSPTKRNSLCIWASLVWRLDNRRRSGERLLQKHILETTFHQIWTKAQSMILKIFQIFFEARDVCNPCSVVLVWK